MLTNFRQDRLVKERRQKIYGVLFVVILILILARGPVFSFVGRVGHFMGIPIWKVKTVFTDSTEFATEYARPKSVLVNELLELRKMSEVYKNDGVMIEVLETENKNIKELFERKSDNRKILTRVLSRPPLQVYDTLIVDIGSKNGVVVGNVVYSNGSYVIGKVTRVYDSTSVVTLLSSPGEVHSIMVSDFNDKSGIKSSSSKSILEHNINFTGIGGGGFHAQIPKHFEIKIGTPMALSSITPSIAGIITGENVPESGSLKDVYGSLPFSINSIDWVYIEVASDK